MTQRTVDTLLQTALAYHRAGLIVLPNDPVRKFPVGLGGWQKIRPTEANIREWFTTGRHAIGIRDTEGIDIDEKYNLSSIPLIDQYRELVESLAPGLIYRLLWERTPTNGYHLVWKCETISGNQKLATRPPTADELRDDPKAQWMTLIETRGTGGQFQVAPSPGYELVRGDWCNLPTITPAERQILLDCARALTHADSRTHTQLNTPNDRPGDRYNTHNANEALSLLEGAGWKVVYAKGDARYLRRPGKKEGVSATFGYVAPGVLYVFTSSGSPFEPERAYKPFSVFALLEHDGDFKAAAKALCDREAATGNQRQYADPQTGEIHDPPTSSGVDTSRLTQSERIVALLKGWGYTFRLNLAGDILECNGVPMSDEVAALIRNKYRDAGQKHIGALEDAYRAEAYTNAYHPVRDYLRALKWDGVHRINRLAACLSSSDPAIVYPDGSTQPTPAVYLFRWLIGAVAKALDGKQHVMLVLGGTQGIGKSRFAQWLCSPLPEYFIESPINPGDKDNEIRLMTKWIWEVSELDATTRKADVAALKGFITKHDVTVRKAYARLDTRAPALASFIGTVNPSAGFLSDDENRRFWITTITKIDWSYLTLNIHQIWAEAAARYHEGVAFQLEACEVQHRDALNSQHQVESVLEGWIEKHFHLTKDTTDRMTAADIVDHLASKEIRLSGSSVSQAMEISRVLKHLKVEKVRTPSWRGYAGITPKYTE